MRYAPPPVHHPVDRPVAGAAPAAVAVLACAAAGSAWALQAAVLDARVAGGAVASLLAIAWSVAEWRSAPRGWLAWNGACWHWHGHARADASARPDDAPLPSGCEVRPTLHLDLQAVMLVRLRPAGPAAAPACPRWIWLERRRAPDAWDDLRRAVVHPAQHPAAAGPAIAGTDREQPAP